MGRMKQESMAREDRSQRAAQLGDLLSAKVGVFCWCNRCGHNAEASTQMLVSQLGPSFPVPEIGARMRCSACGSKDVATRPSWPSRAQAVRKSA